MFKFTKTVYDNFTLFIVLWFHDAIGFNITLILRYKAQYIINYLETNYFIKLENI